jgi:hypothetical protein
VPDSVRVMVQRAYQSRPTAELVELAHERFCGCYACRSQDSFDFAQDVLRPLRLLKREHRRLFRALACPDCESRVRPGTLVLATTKEQIWHTAQSKNFDRLYERELEDFRAFLIRRPLLGPLHAFGRILAKAVGSARKTSLDPASWYRVVAVEVGEPSFEPRPSAKTVNAYRFNFVGQVTWYLGCDVQTAAVEVLRHPQPKKRFSVATVRILDTLPVLDLRRAFWGENPAGNWILREVVARGFVSEPTDDVDESRPQYRVPQYVADLARSHGFRALLYDSTRPSAYDNPEAFGYNLAVFEPLPQRKITHTQLMQLGESHGEGINFDRWPLVVLRDSLPQGSTV